MVIHVASLSDPRLDDYRNIPDPELLHQRGVFVAEGRLVVRRLLTSILFRVRSVLVTPAAFSALADVLEDPGGVPVMVVAQDAINEIVGFNIHRGCLAIGERPAPGRWQDVVNGARRVVILERVSNADNVGGVFRNAAAFGADAVLLGPSCADPLYRKAIRTSMAAALTVPFAAMEDWPSDLNRLGEQGFQLMALTPAPGAKSIATAKAVALRTNRVAILAGHEGDGLTTEALAAAHMRVRIPIVAEVDSLNVATAVAIALYELAPVYTDSP